jgi:hypothetical protein
VCMNLPDIRFTSLGAPRRVWAISAIHGELEKLYAIHDAILERLQAGDRIVYLGNVTGHGPKSRETVDEILTFRRLALSIPGVMPSDLIYIRGRQEDMWQRLLQLQFTHKPEEELREMLDQGVAATLESYDISAHDGMRSCREGVFSISRWTGKIRHALRANPAHDIFVTQHRRAAYTSEDARNRLLFVNAGVNPKRTLEDQGDSLWTSGDDFYDITQAYAPFDKIIRGYDPTHAGVRINCVTASLDGGAGFGGALVCAGVDSRGHIHELLQA